MFLATTKGTVSRIWSEFLDLAGLGGGGGERGRFLFEFGIVSTKGYFVHTLWMVEARTRDRLSAVSTGLMLPISQN